MELERSHARKTSELNLRGEVGLRYANSSDGREWAEW